MHKSTQTIERRLKLKAYLSASKMKDRRTINNGFYVSQQIKIVPTTYEDFQSFGKLGVSSFSLNWDYSHLNGEQTESALKAESTKTFEDAARFLLEYSRQELRLASCFLWEGGKSLNSKEKENANQIVGNMTKELQLL